MVDYVVGKVMNAGLIGMDSAEYGRQLWTKKKLRKPKRCCVCSELIGAGVAAWAPITNGYNRMERLCHSCVCRIVPATLFEARAALAAADEAFGG